MTTDEQSAFIAAIVASQDDDLPRLVYADWLDEHGQSERAALIRVQCELRRVELECDEYLKSDIGHDYPPRAKCAARLHDLRCREKELIRSTDPEMWSLYYKACWPPSRFTFRRGFLDTVRCEVGDWIGEPCPNCIDQGADYDTGIVECGRCDCTGEIGRMGPTILQDFPTVRRVELDDKDLYWNGRAYCWFTDARNPPHNSVPHSAELPDKLFRLLPTGDVSGGDRWFGWESRAEAETALSDACIRFAKEDVH